MTTKGQCDRCGRLKTVIACAPMGPLPAETLCSSCLSAMRPERREALRRWLDGGDPAVADFPAENQAQQGADQHGKEQRDG